MQANVQDNQGWLLNDLLVALTHDPAAAGFEVHYQPIVRLDDATILAVEALARWHHPVAGSVEPGTFTAVAERAGLAAVLDDFVLNWACADADALADVYGRQVDVHVNVSASRMGGLDLEAAVAAALERYQLPPGRLVLEITETSRMDDLGAAAAVVRRLRERGVAVALDDFGSGFNMLAQLHALPVDIIKLDATLTNSGYDAWRTEALCRSVLAICERMSLKVIAEGIETETQARALRRMHCELGQGYLYGPPLRFDQLTP
jgi:EAL domain-containing protein (putative c-di-GMP-specific phosphodiesterase class I)